MADYNQEQNNDLISQEYRDFEPSGNNLEDLLDLIAEALIQSPLVNTSHVEENQKFIRDGILQSGQGTGVLALFQKDIKANQEDLNSFEGGGGEVLQALADSIINFNSLFVSINEGGDYGVSIEISGGGLTGTTDITDFIVQDGTFSNVSQFIPLEQRQSVIDVEKAEEFLDTNIFELLPTSDTRQARIIRFFQELNALLPPQTPQFDQDGTPGVDRLQDGTWIGAEQYSKDNSISYAQDNTDSNIDEEDAFIHRLKSTANTTNSSRTIEDIYNTILPYLDDILEDPIELEDKRPEYENQSSGYLQFRNLNQGIIIRNTNKEFIDGLNPNDLSYLDRLDDNGNFVAGTGFTITMWVRFLDKVSEGTLFNFGNPTRANNPFGFRLETFVLNQDDTIKAGSSTYTFREYMNGQVLNYTEEQNQRNLEYFQTSPLFKNTNTERFVRLQVREGGDFALGTDLGLRDSSLASVAYEGAKIHTNPPDLNRDADGNLIDIDELRILNYTNIPEDFNEWYFICASYNPIVREDESTANDIPNDIRTNPLFWLNHMDGDGNFTNFSELGNKCKVQIISRTDLLRARGFKV